MSEQYRQRAEQRIPGRSQLRSKDPAMFGPHWPGYYRRCKGTQVWDLNGREYTDFSMNGLGACALGYANSVVDNAVRAAVTAGVASIWNCPEEVELAELLCELHPWANRVRYARSGGEAMAVAVRIARAATGRQRVAVNGYHGCHDWYLAAKFENVDGMDTALLPDLKAGGVPEALAGTTIPFSLSHWTEFEQQNRNVRFAAVVVEPMRERYPDGSQLLAVREYCNRTGAVMIADEISAGFRIHPSGAHMTVNIRPDIAVFAKALANGYAMAAIIGNEVLDAVEKTFVSSTNWTERVGPAAALATVRHFHKTSAHARLTHAGRLVQAGWREAAKATGVPLQVNQVAPLAHFQFEENHGARIREFTRRMLERAYVATDRFYPMTAHTEDQVSRYLEAFVAVLRELRK